MLASGLLVYCFHLLAARSLGVEGYGGVAVLWATLFLSVIVAFRPLEQTVSRSIAARRAENQESWTVVRSTAILTLAAVAAFVLFGVLAWDVLTERLFAGDELLTAALLASIGAYGLSYLVRGIVAGAGWYPGYAIFLIADAVALVGIAAPLVVVSSQDLAAAAIVGAGVVGALAPLAVGRSRVRTSLGGAEGRRFRIGAAATFAGPAGVVAVADQLLVNGGPILVMLEGGALRAAGVVFAATMLVRVCVYLFQGVAASILPNLTRLHTLDAARLPRAAGSLVALMLAVGALIVGGAALAGPQAMTVLYGDGFETARLPLIVLGLGIGAYLGASTCSQALLAADAGRAAAAAWALAGAAFVAVYELAGGESLMRIALAFALASAVALLLLSSAIVAAARAEGRAPPGLNAAAGAATPREGGACRSHRPTAVDGRGARRARAG
jgi:O-antigen/teichoic acid export membrane protein